MAEPRLLVSLRERLRARHYSLQTEHAYVQWVRRFIEFADFRHPNELGGRDVERFLTHLAVQRRVAASTQNQALAALLFFYREVLESQLPWLESIVRAKRPQHLPVVLSPEEIRRVFEKLSGTELLIARLLYGSGMRLSECLRLRIKDVDFRYRQITVRDGKGQKDRVTILPDSAARDLARAPWRVLLQSGAVGPVAQRLVQGTHREVPSRGNARSGREEFREPFGPEPIYMEIGRASCR